ncbi:MAG: hypothetical protein ACHP9Z_33230 [Streptosporangiales bacterium]
MTNRHPPSHQASLLPDSWPALVAWAVSSERSVWLRVTVTIGAAGLLLLGIAAITHLALSK